MVTILLIRHGQNAWVKKKRLAGWTPGVHLNDEGRKQADRLAENLAHLPIKAVYSSPLVRCLETARPIAQALKIDLHEREQLGEVRYGRWQGKKLKKLVAKKPSWYAVQHFPSRFRFPEGESLAEVQSRAVAEIEALATSHEKEMIAIVSHADVIKLLLAHYLGLHIDLFQRLAISPASVSVLALFPTGPVHVLRINDDGPIQAPAQEKKSGKKGGKKAAKGGRPGEQKQAAAGPDKAKVDLSDPEPAGLGSEPSMDGDLISEKGSS